MLVALPALALAAPEEALPLWELGLGVGAVTVPDYPGADQTDNYVLPVPYLVYRGDFFKADREGMRARFLDRARYEFDISLGATPPVYSGDSDARGGMPDLSPALEIGPELRIHLARDNDDERLRREEWNLNIPVRHSMAWVDGHVHSVGNIAYPHINWKRKFRWLAQEWNLDADLGAYFNDRSYHQYFYQVDPRYARPGRPAYDAHGGYGGWEGAVFSTRSIGRWRAGVFAQFGSIGGAAFEDSPLVRRMFTLTAGMAVNYVFWESAQRAPADDPPQGAGGPAAP